MKKYTTKEVADLLSVNIRTVQRHIAIIVEELQNNDIRERNFIEAKEKGLDK